MPAESSGKPPHVPVPTGKPPRPSPLSKRSLEHPYAAAGSQQQHTLLRPGSPHNAAIVARLPDTPLGLLRRLVELLRQLEDRLRQLVRDEGDKWRNSAGPSKYSSLSMDPKERVHEEGQPCGGEKMLLMFDRCGGPRAATGVVAAGAGLGRRVGKLGRRQEAQQPARQARACSYRLAPMCTQHAGEVVRVRVLRTAERLRADSET